MRPAVTEKGAPPAAATTNESVKLWLDTDVLAALRASGDGGQTRINDALRASLALAGKLAQDSRIRNSDEIGFQRLCIKRWKLSNLKRKDAHLIQNRRWASC